MARMVPDAMPSTDSAAEGLLYRAFEEQLPDDFAVYHGTRFTLVRPRGGVREGETDFIVAHPEHGVLVIEAKGGEVEYDRERGRWRQSDGRGWHDIDDPFAQAQGELHALVEVLKRRPGWEEWLPSYGHAVAFPDGLYRKAANPGAPPELVIDRDDLDRLDRRVTEIMRRWRREGRSFGQAGMEALADALGVSVTTRVPLQALLEEERRELRKLTLTADQLWLRQLVLGRSRAVVTGPAGSGKTMLSLRVAKDLAAEGERTLLTCFNTALGNYLRLSSRDVPNLDVVHFHRLCYELAREAKLPLGEIVEVPDGAAYFEQELPDLLERATRMLGPRYDAIVVDEAQDFKEWWWPALLSLHRDPDGGRLYLFADSSQNLYGGTLPVADADILPPLPANLRNTRRVNDFVMRYYGASRKPEARGPLGTPVRVFGYDDTDELSRRLSELLHELVTRERVALRDVVLLTPSRSAKSDLRSRGGVPGFEFLDLQDVLKPPEVRPAGRPDAGTSGQALLTATIHKFKGLEAPVVILAEIGERHGDELDTYLYVGASRASSHLIVLAKRPLDGELRRATR